MEQYAISISYNVLAWLATVALLLFACHFLRPTTKLNLPPGPKPWPIIGNFNLIGSLPHRSVHDLSQKYGQIMHLKFGSKRVVVGSSAEMAKVMLKTMDVNFVCRPKLAAGKYTTYNFSDITWSPYGPYWRQARKMCILGLTVDEFQKMLDELFELNGVLNIGDWIPWISFMDLQGYVKRMKAVSKRFDQFLEHVLTEHEERRFTEGESFVPNDMVDQLLQIADDPTLNVKLERHGVKGFTQAIEELDRVIGQDRWVEEKDMSNLPYIKAILKESLRLHPVTPLLVPRRAREDCKIAGYDIPEDTRIFVSVWSIGRDPKLWDKPLEFFPERFIGSEIDIKGNDYELLPFGSGRRMCPGYSLGRKIMESSLANLLHGFYWKLPNGMSKDELKMDEVFGLTTCLKTPLVVVPEPKTCT
ncbi:cytochrome P450 71A1-like protein [Tanacetum coccineum]